MSADHTRRWLRPRFVFAACDHIWVIDEVQPVAALFDPDTERLVRLVSWTDLPPAPRGSAPPQIAVDAAGLWVQNHRDGPLARLGPDGIIGAEYTEGHLLTGAGATGAWCAPSERRRTDIAPAPDIPPRRRPRPPTFLVALPHGGTRRVVVDAAALVSIECDETSLFVGIEHDPWERVPASPNRHGFEVRYSSSVLQVPLDAPIPARIGQQTHPCVPGRQAGYTSEYADVSYNETHRRKRALGAGLRWHWGVDPTRAGDSVVRAYRSGVSLPVAEIDMPDRWVVDGATAGGRLWMIVRSQSVSSADRSVVTAGVDGQVRPVSVGEIDITDRCRPIGPEPLDHASYVSYCLRGLDGRRFSDAVDEVSATYVGQWPHGGIEVSFRHVDYPGLTLVKRLNLYDEQGVRLDAFLAHVLPELMEQAGTGAYPPASDAVGGILYV